MAELDAQLRLDIDQALRDVDRLQGALDRAIAPIEIEVDDRQALQLEDTLREVERVASRAATEVASIDIAAGRAEANFEDLARALNISEDAARRLTGEVLESQAAANRLEDAARDIARQLGLSDTEANRLAGSLREADRAADAIDVTTLTLAGRFSALRTSIGLIGTALAGVGGAAVLGAALVGANNAIQSFARLTDSINAVKVVFGEASGSVLAFGEDAARTAGLSQEAFNQAVAPIGAVLTNFGFNADEASKAAVTLIQRGADLASVYGGSVQDAVLAINSALVGQVEPLRRFGGEISQARVEAFALASGLLQAGDEMDTATTVQARYGLILKDTAVVQNDFLNTSDDLANAQRSAGAALQNFVTDIGEALAPALETILTLVPEAVEGIRQFVPSFAAAGDSAAAFFASMGEGGGFRAEGAGAVAFLDVVTAGSGILANFGGVVAGIGKDFLNLDGTLTATTAAAERWNVILEEPVRRGIAFQLAAALDKGEDAVESFGAALAATARQTRSFETFEKSYRDLANAANLTQPQLQGATRQLLANRVALGLTTPEVRFLTSQMNALNEELDTGGRANADYIANIRGVGDATEPVITALERVRVAASEAGLSMGDLITGVDPMAEALFNTLTPADQLTLKLDGVRSGAVTLADAFGTNLTPAIFDASQALVDFDKSGKVTMSEFIRGLGEGVARMIEFKGNLQTLYNIDPRVVPIILDLPLEEQIKRAEELVNDPIQIPLVITASQDVQGQAALQQAAILKILALVRENAPSAEIGDFIALQIDPNGGVFGEQYKNTLLSVVEFATEGAMDELIAPEFTPIYLAAIEGTDWGAIQALAGRFFADLDPPEYPKPKLPPPPTAEEKARVGDQILELFERDDALNEAAGFTAAAFNDRLIVEMGTRAFATQQDLDAFITTNFTQEDAATTAAEATSGAYVDGVGDVDLGALDIAALITATFGAPAVVTAFLLAGVDGGNAFWEGATSVKGVAPKVKTAVTQIIDDSIGRKSPPKLFLDAGIDSAEAFWMGFEQADLSLRVPIPQMTGKISTSTAADGAAAGGQNINIELHNLETRDADTTIARASQLIGAVAGTLNGNFKL